MITKAVILATGDPTHQSRLVHDRPRAMLPALGKPLVVRVMDQLYRAGIREFTVVVGMQDGTVASYLNAGWVPDVTIDFVLKSASETLPQVLVSLARKLDRPFLITSYNSFIYDGFIKTLFDAQEEYHQQLILSGAHNTLSDSREHYFAITGGQRVEQIVRQRPPDSDEYMSFIVSDLAICGEHFQQYLRGGLDQPLLTRKIFFMEIVQQYLQQDGAQAMIAESSWVLQVETDNDLLLLNKKLLDEGNDTHILSELSSSVKIIPPVRIDPQVSIGQNAVIGPHVYLERGSKIGARATIKNAVILSRSIVTPGITVQDMILSPEGSITG